METIKEINNLFCRLLGGDTPKYLPPDLDSHYFQKQKEKTKGEKIDEF